MSKFNQTKFSEFVNYQGSSTKNLRKFLRKIEKNQRNSINISDTYDKQRTNVGICFKLIEFRELKKETEISEENLKDSKQIINVYENSKFYIRYFINMYNLKTKKMYGNTYQSPYYEIKIEGDNEIKLLDPKPLYVYVLSPDPDNDSLIIQFVITETDINEKENIKSQISERWSLIQLNNYQRNKGQIQIEHKKEENIYKGSPRFLLNNEFNKFKLRNEGTILCTYEEMSELQDINFLLPDYIILSEGEVLPGLANCLIGPEHDFENLVKFETVYIKNIMISISPNLEHRILEFANKYREKKYKINSSSDDYSKYNDVYIKERKLKCGVHNTWCFVNTNGLENSVTLTKKDNSLNYIGILTVDHFFVEESLCGFILELDYIVAIPIIENQKEENLTLPIGYSIFIPEDFDESDQFKRTNFITGPTETIYGEKLWYSPDVSDRIIELGFTLSQNQELIVDNYRSIELEKNKELLKQAQEDYINKSNLIIKGGESEEQKLKILEYEEKIKALKNQIKLDEEKQKQLLDRQKELVQQPPKEIIKYITKPLPQDIKVQKIDEEITEEKKQDLNKNIDLLQSFERLDKNLDELKNNSQIIYEEKLKNIELEEEFFSKTSLGEKNLALPEIPESIIEYN